jgi:hypothetical protein
VIELLDFNLRGDQDAPAVAARVARVTDRYLTSSGVRDITAVVTELVGWLGDTNPVPRALRLELSVTSAVVRICVTAPSRLPRGFDPMSNRVLRQRLPLTASLASRYGVESRRRTRIWAEFDRREAGAVVTPGVEYSR